MTRRSAHPRAGRRGPQPTRVRRHPYTPTTDPALDGYCARCGLRGEPGDTRHISLDDIEAQRQYEQRKLGDHD